MKLIQIFPTILFFLAVAVGLTGCDMRRDSGLWRGTVVVHEDDGRPPYTCEVEIDITHTGDSVTLHHMYRACDAFASRWNGDSYDLRDDNLYFRGRNIGWARDDGSAYFEISEDEMKDRFPILADQVAFSWMRVDDRLEFTEEVIFAGRVQRSTGWLERAR